MTATPGEDVVVIHIAGGPSLWLHPEHARELLLAQQDPGAQARAAEAPLAPGEVAVPSRLQWRLEDATSARGATRGFLGDVLIHAIDTVTPSIEDTAADFAASQVVKRFDSQVTPGVYQLTASSLGSLKGQPAATITATNATSLVLIHGTFSTTAGTFGKLWTDHPQLVRSLFKLLWRPGLRARSSDAWLQPDRQRHHARSRAPGRNTSAPADALARRAGCRGAGAGVRRPGRRARHLHCGRRRPARRAAGAGELSSQAKGIHVERVVRVACPARGTLLASKRLDAYVSVLKWALELAGAAGGAGARGLSRRGRAATRQTRHAAGPRGANSRQSARSVAARGRRLRLAGDLRVVAGDLQGDSVVSWVKTLLADAFYWTDNDLVVQTRSMYGGSPRANDSTFVLDQGGKVSHFNYFSNADDRDGRRRCADTETRPPISA